MRLQTLESIFNVDGKDMIVLPFKSYLLNLMDLHPEDRQHVDQIPGYLNYLVCFGIVPQWPGVAELWLIPDRKLIQKWRLKFHKGAKKFMELAADELNLHRLHVTVSANNVRSVKWIEHIYFKREGVLKKYSFNKKDMIMYSRLF
jgi:RimJ/RimL family protein N-acetyltransferase